MQLLLSYMYRGEINVNESALTDLLATAMSLQIKGLVDVEEFSVDARGKRIREETNAAPDQGEDSSSWSVGPAEVHLAPVGGEQFAEVVGRKRSRTSRFRGC
jgi:hypothetical protein